MDGVVQGKSNRILYFFGPINATARQRTLWLPALRQGAAAFDRRRPGWMVSESDLWWIPEYLLEIPHVRLLTPAMEDALTRVDRRSLEASLVGHRPH